ncbi:MAG: trypsin-like peptidase domain-containing protein [Actinomycetota bacterium]|nr:trypsin-like peptidase domain-containing protein [Actinomycetota bacterium]MDQ2956551.1 trypsin-like peptidase domain-containing protein [Actinomycetota bacterium]
MSEESAGSPFSRPDDVDGAFEPRTAAERELPSEPRPAVSAADRDSYQAPAGSRQPFDPAPGHRLPPRHDRPQSPVPYQLAESFGGSGQPFEPAPGDRLPPTRPGPGSPWWKEGAATDPWRDALSPYWIAGPPVFAGDDLVGIGEPIELDDEPPVDPTSAKGGRRARFGLSTLAIVLVAGLIAGVVGGGAGYWLSERAHRVLTDPNLKLATVGTPANRPPGSIADIAKRVSPAVVSIDVRSADAAGSGSGVIIDKGGYILTNNHVVNFGSKLTIRVVFADQSSATGQVVGTDPQDDLAVVKVAKTGLTVASLGDSSTLAVGDPVVAIGDPLGLRGTVTSGIVSSLKRPLRLPGENGEPDAVIDAIQTDAAINPGNSGGALVAADGSVVGINTAIASLGQAANGAQSGNIGVGFSIPINTARMVAESLIRTGKVVHADLGVSSRSVSNGGQDGAYLVQVVPGGPADKAGLKEGDVVTLFDKELVDSGDALTVAVSEAKPGQAVTLRYSRNGVSATAKVTLGTS